MKQTSWKLVFLVKMKRLFIMLLNKEGVWISPTSLLNQSLIDWPDIGIFWFSTPPASKSPAPIMDLRAQDQRKIPKSQGLQWDLRILELDLRFRGGLGLSPIGLENFRGGLSPSPPLNLKSNSKIPKSHCKPSDFGIFRGGEYYLKPVYKVNGCIILLSRPYYASCSFIRVSGFTYLAVAVRQGCSY